jgi:hypothetical protein
MGPCFRRDDVLMEFAGVREDDLSIEFAVNLESSSMYYVYILASRRHGPFISG